MTTTGRPAGVTAHAEARAAERCLRAPTPEEWRVAVLAILDGSAVLARSDPRSTVAFYMVQLGGQPTLVGWCRRSGCIVTVLARGQGNKAALRAKRSKGRAGWKGRRPDPEPDYHHE